MTDNVHHPQHYENGPYECILLAEQYSFNVGNMIKYVWRHKDKGHPKEDLQKALWYAKRAVEDSEGFAPCKRWFRTSTTTETFHWPGTDAATLLMIKSNLCTNQTETKFWKAVAENSSENTVAALETMIEETE